MAAVPLARHTQGKPRRRAKASSKAARFGPAVETQFRSKASFAYRRSWPPMCGTDRRIRRIGLKKRQIADYGSIYGFKTNFRASSRYPTHMRVSSMQILFQESDFIAYQQYHRPRASRRQRPEQDTTSRPGVIAPTAQGVGKKKVSDRQPDRNTPAALVPRSGVRRETE